MVKIKGRRRGMKVVSNGQFMKTFFAKLFCSAIMLFLGLFPFLDGAILFVKYHIMAGFAQFLGVFYGSFFFLINLARPRCILFLDSPPIFP